MRGFQGKMSEKAKKRGNQARAGLLIIMQFVSCLLMVGCCAGLNIGVFLNNTGYTPRSWQRSHHILYVPGRQSATAALPAAQPLLRKIKILASKHPTHYFAPGKEDRINHTSP
jgi:hypothetical protein